MEKEEEEEEVNERWTKEVGEAIRNGKGGGGIE